jgi:hypothetical protein
MATAVAKGQGGGRGKKRRKKNDEWPKEGKRIIIKFRVDDEDVQFPAVVASVKTKTTTRPGGYQETQISEVTVKYADASRPLLNAEDAGDNMDGAFHGVHLMESRPAGPILHDENSAARSVAAAGSAALSGAVAPAATGHQS